MFIKQKLCSFRAFRHHITLCLLCLPTAYSRVCSNTLLCETFFQKFTDLQLSGSGQQATSRRSPLACARSCFLSQDCTTFSFSGNICKTCPGSMVTGLTFVPGQNIFLLRTLVIRNLNYDAPDSLHVHQVFPIPGGISSGRVGYLHATLLAEKSFNIDFIQDPDALYVNFHFKARWESTDKRLVLSQCNNGTWGNPDIFPALSYPFSVNMPLTLHVLVTPKRFDVYVNSSYCCSYNHTLSVANVRYMRVSGNLDVHEMSV